MEQAVGDLWEPWMRQADRLLEDEKLLSIVYEALLRRYPKSRARGRLGFPAEIVVRMLLLKHIRNWSYDVLEREVRPNLLYREFTRVYAGKVPDAKTLGRQARALGPEVIEQIQQRMVELAVENKVVQGRRMRVDTTVVETNIHYPTDSSLLGDGTRVLTRLMKKVTGLTGAAGTRMRDRSRSVKLRVLDIARAARSKAPQSREKLKQSYRKLLDSTGRVVGQAKRFSQEIAEGVKRCSDLTQKVALEGLRKKIDAMLPLVKQVIRQTKARIVDGDTRTEGKIFSIFEPSTEIIRKGKAAKPNEFGKLLKVQEAENQIIVGFEVYDQRPSDSDLLIPALAIHEERTGRTPDLASARRRLLFGEERSRSKATGRETGFHSQPLHQKRGTQTVPEAALVQKGAEVQERM
jgi:IS5 family transposase